MTPQFAAFAARYRAAVDGGLTAAAYVYRNAVVARLMKGYTSGAFVTPHVARTVTLSAVFDRGTDRVILVGTNIDYAAFWEFGHFNLFTRKYERVEHWREAAIETAPQQAVAFARTFRRMLET